MATNIYVDNTKVNKIFVDNTRVRRVYIDNSLVFTGAEFRDVGMRMNSCKLVLGNGAHNPISGGVGNNWSICFHFVWKSAKGGALLYHNYNNRESIIKLENDGRIMVNANRYDTNSYKTWYSTLKCQVGKLNRVLVTKNGQIFINGQNATPGTYGGDMNFWGELSIFPDRDIDGTCLGITSWNWILGNDNAWVTNLGYLHETDTSTFAMNFNNSTAFRLNSLSGALKSTTGTPVYETYDVYDDWVALKV